MKRLLLAIGIIALLAGGVWAQTYAEFEHSFQAFADDVSESLPITASVGLNWSHAYIGQFPHFGVGLSLGGMFLPYESIQPIVQTLGTDVESSIPEALKTYGLPFPTYAVGARLGGFFIPFDIGFKFGIIPEKAKDWLGENVTADFFLIGGDVRFPVVKGHGLVPTLAVGGGYTFLRGQIGITKVSSGETIDISDPMNLAGYGGVHTLTITDPDLLFSWDTHTIEAKAQASWKLLLFTPSLGIGAAYGISNAGGGLFSSLSYAGPNDLDTVQDVFSGFGYPVPTTTGIEVVSKASGWSFWVFGGTAINIFFIKVDLSAMYNFLNGDYGGSVNVRLQL